MLLETGGWLKLSGDPAENGLRPSVSSLFRSVADVYGKAAVGVILTGMGRDGVDDLRLLKEKGATTIAQDKTSSVIYGMPGEAVRAGAAGYLLKDIDPDDLQLVHVMHQRSGRLSLFFEVRKWSGDLVNAEPDKCEALDWIPVDHLPTNMVAYAAVALQLIQNGENLGAYGWD